MEQPRWWHVAITAISAVLAALAATAGLPLPRLAAAQIALAAFVVGWFLIGRHGFRSRPAALIMSGITIVAVGAAIAAYPLLAILQCVAYPLLWVLSARLREAILANGLLAAAVGVGFWISTGDLMQALLTAALSLGFSLALGLWITQIAERSEERQRLLDELRATQDRLAAAAHDAGIAGERERLARELHDTIAQDLTGLVLLVQRAQRESAAGSVPPATLELLEESARSALADTRALVAASAPVGLGAGGIVEALRRLGERFERETGVRVTVRAAEAPALGRDIEVVLLRCAQEGLANVRKHAAAAAASISITAADGSVRLEVRDDGRGFTPQDAPTGFGLDGMRDRLALVGGDLDVSSSPAGTVLRATLPLAVTA